MRKWLVVFASICLMESAQAVCLGVVAVGKEWTIVKGDEPHFAQSGGCSFRTNSKVGRRILATCPNESECAIVVPLSQSYEEIVKNITHVERITTETDDPYKEGIRDYYAGQCRAAQPEYDSEDKRASWMQGFRAAHARDHNRADRSYCGPKGF